MSEILTQSGAVLQSDFLDSFFQKGELIPAIVQESGSKRSVDAGVYESRIAAKDAGNGLYLVL